MIKARSRNKVSVLKHSLKLNKNSNITISN